MFYPGWKLALRPIADEAKERGSSVDSSTHDAKPTSICRVAGYWIAAFVPNPGEYEFVLTYQTPRLPRYAAVSLGAGSVWLFVVGVGLFGLRRSRPTKITRLLTQADRP
jgi:hypothetical protein